MNIDWAALGQVFGVSLLATVALVGIFTLGILGTSGAGRSGTAEGGSAPAGGGTAVARAGAYLCFAVCAAAVAYGIYIIAA
ncbi:hypothetical protein MTQ01_10960 [Streptomyces sp. XM4193]|uniref:hypothetical protein n=1 Tax=Streptomyces sp. XM4193 TaxID=2929782 RepID=UPI001FFA6348|nr:hypothetical protein [Streptomyces sp. XM4193]MCK1796520.1 hypothetical protein [Streptomyces sp. XM4193]